MRARCARLAVPPLSLHTHPEGLLSEIYKILQGPRFQSRHMRLDGIYKIGCNSYMNSQQIPPHLQAFDRSTVLVFLKAQSAHRSRQTREALEALRRKGAKLGRAPYGWRKVAGPDGRLTLLVQDSDEQGVISTARELHGQMTLEQVAAELSARGISTRSGRPWNRRVLGEILAREVDA